MDIATASALRCLPPAAPGADGRPPRRHGRKTQPVLGTETDAGPRQALEKRHRFAHDTHADSGLRGSMDHHTTPSETVGSTQNEFLRQLPRAFEDLVEHWHIVRKRSCPLQEIKDLRGRTEKLVDHLRDKSVDRLLDRVRRLDERLHVHVRTRQPLSRNEVETITSIMMALRQAGIEEVPAELRKRARQPARAAPDSALARLAPIAPAATTASPVVFLIAPAEADTSTLAEDLRDYGFDVRVFAGCGPALRALPDPPPNAFIARLPTGQAIADLRDGTQALREKIPASVPVFWIVDHADSAMRLSLLRAGGDGCFQAPVPTASLAARLRQRFPAQDRPPHRVLLVHADPETRKRYTALLHEAGLVVESVDDPLQALPVALSFAPEVMLVDASLPAMSGLELAQLVREEDVLQTVPIVLLGAGADLPENRHPLRQLQIDSLLPPFAESDLLERLWLRAAQYRSAAARGADRTGSPGVFLVRSRFEAVLEHARTTAGAHRVRAVLFLEIEGYAQLTQSQDRSILGTLPARMASALRPYLASEDVATRYDEPAYAVLIHRAGPESLEALEQSLRQAAADIPREDLRLNDVRVRLGMARVGPNGDVRAALREAATRCRSAVQPGPTAENERTTASPAQSPRESAPTRDAAEHGDWGRRIRDAILGDKLFLVFQPFFSVKGNDAIERYEVLLRIRDDHGGVCLPAETLAMAEQLGMSVVLDRWVIDTALRELSVHRRTAPNTTFFLKLTRATLQDVRFLDWLEETLQGRLLEPTAVVLQVREADAIAHRQRTQAMVRRLREQGMAVALEHFGLRTTALELVKALDVNFVKLDPTLVQALADGSKDAPSILHRLHQIRALGVAIIAPCVENADHLAKLWNEQVDLVQGNFLHGPDRHLAYDPVIGD